jgi:phenylalanyl-tRNA synthetase alpha subunit
VWDIFGSYFLGHDEPKYLVKKDFLKIDGLWCHAKNIQGLYSMLEDNIHCFWHQEDDVTLTSKGYMWTYPGKELTMNSIAVLPEEEIEVEVAGICSDYVVRLI